MYATIECNVEYSSAYCDGIQSHALVVLPGSDFKVYIPRLLPHALKALANDLSPDRRVTDKLLDTLVVLGCTLEEYLHLLLPPLVRLFEQPVDNEPLRKKAIMTVDKLADTLDVSQFGSMIVHGLIRVIDSSCSNDLKDVSLREWHHYFRI